jgi:hypothetical protein
MGIFIFIFAEIFVSNFPYCFFAVNESHQLFNESHQLFDEGHQLFNEGHELFSEGNSSSV